MTPLKEKLWITLLVLLVAAGMYVWSIPCPFRAFLGIRCPGCGMTRALVSALQLRFLDAFSYHLMFWSVPVLYVCFLKDGKLFSASWANGVFYLLTGFGFLWNWLCPLM